MYYILFYKTVPDYLERRGQFREEHLKLVRNAFEAGSLVMAGAFAEPADGAALIFKADNSTVAENFAKNDIYTKNGLIENWYVRPWTVVIGG
jgi:hypothetical protein